MKYLKSEYLAIILLALFSTSCHKNKEGKTEADSQLEYTKIPDAKPKNVVFILTDDHRYDFMGFTGKVPWLETPAMDSLASQGAYFTNAYVTTSLCSPSRASILTGLYSHSHTVVDNISPDPGNLIFFPQYLQEQGYQTAFFGKWHIGEDDDRPRPGFDYWASFKGQGVYYNPTLNINGEHKTFGDSTYITDLLTDLAVDWIEKRDTTKPFFLYVSHKAVHANFQPAPRHEGKYKNEKIIYPPSFTTPQYGIPELPTSQYNGEPLKGDDYYGENRMPDWVKNQRESWHGVDYMYHGEMDFEEFYKRYTETLLAVDESIARVMNVLEEQQIGDSTLVIYMGDNGFSFGEHGLIDKRQFYEESAKIPFLIRYPSVLKGGEKIDAMVQNIDVAPTILEIAGIEKPGQMQGYSLMPLLKGETPENWRNEIFYEYYWENDFPQTPTMHGVRNERYKYIRYQGIWDTNEFYDLQEDPNEMHNLIASSEYQDTIKAMANDLYDWLEQTGGMQIPLKRVVRPRWGDHRNKDTY